MASGEDPVTATLIFRILLDESKEGGVGGHTDTHVYSRACTHTRMHTRTHAPLCTCVFTSHLPGSSGSSLIYLKVPKLTVKVGVERRKDGSINSEHNLFCLTQPPASAARNLHAVLLGYTYTKGRTSPWSQDASGLETQQGEALSQPNEETKKSHLVSLTIQLDYKQKSDP